MEMGQPGAPITTANPPWGCVVLGLLNTMGFVSFFSSHHFSFYFCLVFPPFLTAVSPGTAAPVSGGLGAV